jgi:Xaa-Pro aminopeptidase
MSHAPTAALRARHDHLRAACRSLGVDALVVTSLPNVLYLTNFDGSAAIAVLTATRLYFITDFRYITATQAMMGQSYECPDLELVIVNGSYDATLTGLLASLPGTRIGFESGHVTVARYDWWRQALTGGTGSAREWIATTGVVERARVVKDDYEIATLREAGRRLSAVARDVASEVRAGRTELEIAMAIDWRIRTAGFSRTAFDTIVASGPNAALPHARPGERRLVEGDLVVLDFGGVYDSYCVDLTRTVTVGRAAERAREVYHAVLEAHDRAIASVKPGQTRFAIDAAARDTLARHGLGEAFGHGTGHGLGIEVHEEPRVTRRRQEDPAQNADDDVVAGMVFTIEPGAYLAGWGGVRIEDDVLVTQDGVETLTDAPTGLIET